MKFRFLSKTGVLVLLPFLSGCGENRVRCIFPGIFIEILRAYYPGDAPETFGNVGYRFQPSRRFSDPTTKIGGLFYAAQEGASAGLPAKKTAVI